MSIYEKINELILVNLEQHICNEVFRWRGIKTYSKVNLLKSKKMSMSQGRIRPYWQSNIVQSIKSLFLGSSGQIWYIHRHWKWLYCDTETARYVNMVTKFQNTYNTFSQFLRQLLLFLRWILNCYILTKFPSASFYIPSNQLLCFWSTVLTNLSSIHEKKISNNEI